MITTIVLVRTEPRLTSKCAQEIAGLSGVTEVYSVSGEWDLVAIVRVPKYEDIARIVTEEFPKVSGLQRTMTLTAFKAYSKADTERAFA